MAVYENWMAAHTFSVDDLSWMALETNMWLVRTSISWTDLEWWSLTLDLFDYYTAFQLVRI